VLFDRADNLEERRHGTPFNVVARRVLEDLQQRVSVVIVEFHGRWGS
jgi:hypothetical protein